MDEAEAEIVKAEVIAIQAVLMSVFRRLATDRADLAPLFCQAFDEAETIMAGVAVKLGLDVPLPAMTGAITVLEELRRAVLGDEGSCHALAANQRSEDQP
jgi:hypothetical protein